MPGTYPPIPYWMRIIAGKCTQVEYAGTANNPFIMSLWKRLGVNPKNDEGLEWCAAGADWLLEEAGLPFPSQTLSDKRQAAFPATYRTVGRQCNPIVGAIAVKKANAHVTFILGIEDGWFLSLGFNQGHRVGPGMAKISDFDAFRWPDPDGSIPSV